MMDRMDRSDTLGGVLEAITDILSAVLNGTDAQVGARAGLRGAGLGGVRALQG